MGTGEDGAEGQRNQGRFWSALVDLIRSYAAYNRVKIENARSPKPKREGLAAWITAFGTVLGATLAGVAAYVFWGQLGAMQDAARDSQKSLATNARAFIFTDGLVITHTDVEWRISIAYKNGGNTFANAIKIWSGEASPMAQDDMERFPPHTLVLGPGQRVVIPAIGIPDNNVADDFKPGGKIGPQISGVIRYADSFDARISHVTKFCYGLMRDWTSSATTLGYSPCLGGGNCADEQCKTKK